MELLYWLVPLIALVALGLVFWLVGRRHSPAHQLQQARAAFHDARKRLEAQFFQVTSTSGKPRGLRWKECQWSEPVAWVREKESGRLLALVGVTISFEAIEGGEMEGVEAVGNLRNGSAVFFFQDGQWDTGGRVIFNLGPEEAIEHFKEGYERIPESNHR